jgi:chitin synthase
MVSPDLQVGGGSGSQAKHAGVQTIVPIQMMLCLKERNAKKLNSHKWLFRAIALSLNPQVVVLIDVGTRPKTLDSIYHLWRAFDRRPTVAGACGEICVMQGKQCYGSVDGTGPSQSRSIFNPLLASQVQYFRQLQEFII